MSAEPVPTFPEPCLSAPAPTVEGPTLRMADGIICLGGEDWWYHNRGHYDMQMMRELSRDVPVLYVNSIGMRVPSAREGRMFLTRVSRKLRSFRKGFVRVRDNFGVVSPVAIPGTLGNALTGSLVRRQIRSAAQRMGITRPLLWVANPRGAEMLDEIDHTALVYQRTDRFEDFLGVDRAFIRDCDRRLKERAQLTLFCSGVLHAEERGSCAASAFVDHGVDYDAFACPKDVKSEPEDLRGIARPRVGFVGGIDKHTFDPELFLKIAHRLPSFRFVMVGACSLPDDWCELKNVHFLGRKPYEQVASYMSACDVLIMPWNKSEWIQACNPVKLKEYLATGKPVVSSPFPQLERFGELVRIAPDADSFVRHITQAISAPHDPQPGRSFVENSTWRAQADTAHDALKDAGIHVVAR